MITDLELEKGYKLALENASELIDDAWVLQEYELFPRAYALFQLAIEEIGKCHILYEALLDYYMGIGIDEEYLKNKGFERHKQKTKRSILVELYTIHLFEKNGKELTTLKETLKKDYENTCTINDLKNQSLYVDIKNETFISPKSVITKEMVDEISSTANIRYGGISPYLQPLTEMKKIAEELKEILNDPKKSKEFNDELGIV